MAVPAQFRPAQAPEPKPESDPRSEPMPDPKPSSAASAAGSIPRAGLLADEHDKLQLRLQHAVSGFVDDPRSAVEEAGALLDDLADRIHAALAERRSALRTSWQDADGDSATEDLRTALRSYRDLAERLLHL
ncbi:hypothetical protein ACFQLX_14845 [Streptomyces polyrhachis]|uniref:Uncharacterized protein n=1 Tax=Streptomyces polyrhachis TaxID=1282885 RepID=A0ABW2GIS5_9ACTN